MLLQLKEKKKCVNDSISKKIHKQITPQTNRITKELCSNTLLLSVLCVFESNKREELKTWCFYEMENSDVILTDEMKICALFCYLHRELSHIVKRAFSHVYNSNKLEL